MTAVGCLGVPVAYGSPLSGAVQPRAAPAPARARLKVRRWGAAAPAPPRQSPPAGEHARHTATAGSQRLAQHERISFLHDKAALDGGMRIVLRRLPQG